MEKIKVKIINFVSKVFDWIKKNPAEFWILVAILAVAAFCRLYRISDYMTFLGDEGRDVIVVRRLLTQGHPPLIGPGTSIGNMYLGPLYYYMMAPALLIANFSPVGPAVQIAILGVITVWLVWYVGQGWFGKTAGLIAAGLYAISPVVIIYSRSSWNPNIMPFFALLSMFSVWKVWRDHKVGWLIVLGISYAAVLQSHYLGLLLAPTIGIFWLLFMKNIWKDLPLRKLAFRYSLYAVILFLLLMSPLFFFDLRHNWMNFKAMYTFFTVRQETVSIKPWTAIPKLPEMLDLLDLSVVAAKNSIASVITSVIIAAGIIWVFVRSYFKKKNFKIPAEYWFLLSWIGFGLIGFGLYKQNIYDHYFGFIFVVPFLFIGSFISMLISDGKLMKIVGIGILGYLVAINLVANPLRKEPNKLLQRSLDVSKVIEQQSGGKSFNLAVIADTNYEDGYKYFLLKDNYPVIDIDAQKPDTITSQLFAVCELIPNSKCDPTHNPKAQVANFGWSKIDGQWEVDGAIVYRLVHSQ